SESEASQHSSLYYDNVYPLRIGIFDLRHYIVRTSKKRLETKVKSGKWIPQETEMPFNFKIEGVEPRKREGGMLVNFTFSVDPARKSEALNEIYKNVEAYISAKNIIPWFNLKPLEVYMVKGEPFIEDLANRFPASRLHVEFQGPDVSIETLYQIFRPYGLIRDIILPQPSSKDAPRFALIQFSKMRSATSARNCVHGLITDGTRLNIVYDKTLKSNMIYSWMIAHPRTSIPLIAAAIAGITYTIFDPIRTFFITSKITQRFNPQEYRIYQWLRRETIDRLLTYPKFFVTS
ncbi:10969_t:CDS:2, partial [Entrophospora sp. SA101]